MAGLELTLLGGLSVSEEGKRLRSIRSKKGKALLAYLAMTGQPASRLALAGLFWPDKPEEDALMNLRKVLHLLNQELALYLHTNRESVGLAEEAHVWVDALEFEVAARKTPTTLATLEQAGELYQGAFLKGFYLSDCAEFEDWMTARREALQNLALESFWRITGERRKAGDYQQAEQSARRHIALDNLDERGHRDLMEVLALQGRRAEALQQYESCRRILEAELGVEPAPATVALAERIRLNQLTSPTAPDTAVANEDAEPPVSRDGPRLPSVAPLIGRENELAMLRDYLGNADGRIVTIVGAGGIGKTSLALTLAEQESGKFADGVCYVSLDAVEAGEASASDSARKAVIGAIGAAMGHPLQQDEHHHAQQLHKLLGERQLLLVLDNFEPLIAGAQAVADLARAAPRVTVLITSREPLGLYGEQLLPLSGLYFAAEEISESDAAAQLFLLRARRRDPTFGLGDKDLPYLRQICQTVAGSPLALELAAANLEGLSLPKLAEELTKSIDLLSTTWSDVPERHRSIRSVLDASWNQLTPEERRVFCCLSVFRNSFSGDAAHVVCAPQSPSADCHQVLAALLRKSLLNYDRTSNRYSMHELLAQFAAEKLSLLANEEAGANSRHSDYFMTWVAQLDSDWNTATEEEALETLMQEESNVRKAWRWALDHDQWARLVDAFDSWQTYHRWQITIAEFNDICQELLQRTGRAGSEVAVEALRLRAKATISLLWSEPDQRKAARMADETHTLLDFIEERGADVTEDRATLLRDTAFLVSQLGNPALAVEQLERSKALFEQRSRRWEVAKVEGNLAVIDWRHGRHASAVRRQENVLAIAQHLGSKRSEGAAAFNLGLFLRSLGQLDRSAELQRTAIEEGRRQEYGLALTRYKAGLARTLLWQGQLEEAKRLTSEALSTAQASHFPQYVAWTRAYLAEIQLHGGQYHQARGQLEIAQLLLREQNASFQLPDGGSVYTLLGELAIVQNAWTEADTAFAKGRESLDQSWHRLDLVFSLAGMGRSALGQRRIAAARRYLSEALNHAMSLNSYPGVVYTLPIVALFFAENDDEERGRTLWEVARLEPFVNESAWFSDTVGRVMNVRLGFKRQDKDRQQTGKLPDLWQASSEALDALGNFHG